MAWKEWAGYHAVRSYDTCHEREYYALRHAAGLIDVTPLFKYEVHGPEAARFLSRVMVRDITKLKPGRVTYVCWCDDDGKVVDDGTVSCLDEGRFRVTAAEPALAWMHRHAGRYQVEIEDSSRQLGALALQGPNSAAILAELCDAPLGSLKFFGLTPTRIAGVDVTLTRTGYTGDLGYEVWVPAEQALVVWDALIAVGQAYRLEPAGLDALDVTRVEAGFVMNGVDYFSAHHCLIDSRKSSPYELGLGWTVRLKRDPFIGQAALRAEQQRGPRWSFRGIEIDWDAYERLFAEFRLPPNVATSAWRSPVPIYHRGRQIGYATSGAWSPILKSNLALATLENAFAKPGTEVDIEVTAEFERRKVLARVVETPFFDPPRKRDLPRLERR